MAESQAAYNQLIEILKNIDPDMLDKTERNAELSLKKDKQALFDMFIKGNKAIKWDALATILNGHTNHRLQFGINYEGQWIFSVTHKPKREKNDGE